MEGSMRGTESAIASELFDQFCAAVTVKAILATYRRLTDFLRLKPTNFPDFYPKLKAKLKSWKAQALWSKFDKRASNKCYNRGRASANTRVLIIGGGPCGLRTAIEAQLLGAKVVVVEKRDRFSRNNVLHLWPFVIHDLRALGAKKFFGKFCAGAIDHISIRQIQCILLKVALLLGVEVHENVVFEGLIEPPEDQTEKIGWRAHVLPVDHPVSQYEFDVLIGADGKRNTLEGFKRKEFRGKLAIAITANFINRHSEAEARVEEISGVAFIFNQKFFRDLHEATGIDLENIVYYKDETHYFVMTAKKHSLINKGVIMQDYADTARLLAAENVSKEALLEYAHEAADYATGYKLPQLEFAVNHYGQPDVAMFDFTSMYAAENASRCIERRGHRLLMVLVGDSLLEPFWPTGSGCARGFLSSLDACWMIRSWSSGKLTPMEVLAERESIYRLLAQTTPENLSKELSGYTLEPHTRYPNLNLRSVISFQVRSLYDTDNPEAIEKPQLIEPLKKKRRRDDLVNADTLLQWLQKQVSSHDIEVTDMDQSFKSGMVLCTLIHHFRPDLINIHELDAADVADNNQLVFDVLETEFGIPPMMSGEEMAQVDTVDRLTMILYLSQIYNVFRGEIPHVKHPKMDDSELIAEELASKRPTGVVVQSRSIKTPSHVSVLAKVGALRNIVKKRHSGEKDGAGGSTLKRARRRRSGEKDKTAEDQQTRIHQEIVQNRLERQRRQKEARALATMRFIKSMQLLQANLRRSVSQEDNEEDEKPYEDVSIFLYRQTAPQFEDRVKDLEQKLFYADLRPSSKKTQGEGGSREDFTGRVKDLEDKLREGNTKKPKDLIRAIGKIDKTDWNVKIIEKKIHDTVHGVPSGDKSKEKVPKWNRDTFDDKFHSIEQRLQGQGLDEATLAKYVEIDQSLRRLDKKLHEGTTLEVGMRGSNKVSAMASKLDVGKRHEDQPSHPVHEAPQKPAINFQQTRSECYFCKQKVYLMERLTAEGKCFHRGCFRCEYCNTQLRLGNYMYDREGKFGRRFFCSQHFGYQPPTRTTPKSKPADKVDSNKNGKSLSSPYSGLPSTPVAVETKLVDHVSALATLRKTDSADELQLPKNSDLARATPERVEFENSFIDLQSEDECLSEMDEDEWTDHNFGGVSANEVNTSEDSVSELSDDEVFEKDAVNGGKRSSHTKRFKQKKYVKQRKSVKSEGNAEDGSDTAEDKYSDGEYDNEEEDTDTPTEKDDVLKRREQRKQEVRLEVPERPVVAPDSDGDSGSDTEVVSDECSEEECAEEEEEEDEEEEEEVGSATEIETDSEFTEDSKVTHQKHDIPEIVIESEAAWQQQYRPAYNRHISAEAPKSEKIEPEKAVSTTNLAAESQKARLPPLLIREPFSPLRSSTEGIASKVSLELKKKYLQGDSRQGLGLRKTESASGLDSRFQSFLDTISAKQKLLNPAPQPSLSMQAFLEGTARLHTSPTALTSTSPVESKSSEKAKKKLHEILTNEANVALSQLSPANEESEFVLIDKEKDVTSEICLELAVEKPVVVHVVSRSASPDYGRGQTNGVLIEENRNVELEANNTDECLNAFENDQLVHETTIEVPTIPWKAAAEEENDKETLKSSTASDDEEEEVELSDGELAVQTKRRRAEPPLPSVAVEDADARILPLGFDITDLIIPRRKGMARSRSMNDKLGETADDTKSRFSTHSDDIRLIQTNFATLTASQPKLHLSGLLSGWMSPGSKDSPESALGTVYLETELSDWARDTDDATSVCDDLEFDTIAAINTNVVPRSKQKDARMLRNEQDIANENQRKSNRIAAASKILNQDGKAFNPDLDSMEFMDVGNGDHESSSDEEHLVRKQGYRVLLAEEEEDDALTPVVEDPNLILANATDNGSIHTSESSSSEEELDQNLDTPVTSCKRSIPPTPRSSSLYQTPQLTSPNVPLIRTTPFQNAKDSIDMRRAKKPTYFYQCISKIAPEEVLETDELEQCTPPSTVSQKLTALSQERLKQSDLVHDLVLQKINKRTPDRPGTRSSGNQSPLQAPNDSFSPNDGVFAQTPTARPMSAYVTPNNNLYLKDQVRERAQSVSSNMDQCRASLEHHVDTPEVFSTPAWSMRKPRRPFSVHLPTSPYLGSVSADASPMKALPEMPFTNSVAFSMPDIRQASFYKMKTQDAEKENLDYSAQRLMAREAARARARLLTDEELGLSPQDYAVSLKERLRRKDSGSDAEALLSTPSSAPTPTSGTTSRESSSISPVPTRVAPDHSTSSNNVMTSSQSTDFSTSHSSKSKEYMPLVADESKAATPQTPESPLDTSKKKKSKDRERRKSIIDAITGLFVKSKKDKQSDEQAKDSSKSSSSKTSSSSAVSPDHKAQSTQSPRAKSPKDLFRLRLTPKSKAKAKEKEKADSEKALFYTVDVPEQINPCEVNKQSDRSDDGGFLQMLSHSTKSKGKGKAAPHASEESFSEPDDSRSCSLSHSRMSTVAAVGLSSAASSASGGMSRKQCRQAQRAARQAEMKRLRMAQEIQRKLEEIEVKQKNLEQQGVALEKALRGEGCAADSEREEAELMQEWFALMHQKTELRRYEQELSLKAKDLELEDRHERLQMQLRSLLSVDDSKKTELEKRKEVQLTQEMLRVVSDRDAIVAATEENRLSLLTWEKGLAALNQKESVCMPSLV